ncbi:hypothetical protein HHK36_027568 [Tetracentron sinense]|uniref:Uncharacterized protein n=1 Tax=Tetracentron sinense TaxID=13715 RepID=A0A835D4J2_TETSI|nr:hypothetical protein HHK36_027568 [Tetracentron sinense]
MWQGIWTTLSQSNGGYKYDYATVPFLAEVFKLLVSSFLLWRECQASPPPRMTTEWKSVRLFPIPSIIYLIHNNVQFATLTYVDTSTYQIMGNLKIVTTGILFRLFLRRKLSNLQWMAIVMLAVGTTTSQVIMGTFHINFILGESVLEGRGGVEALFGWLPLPLEGKSLRFGDEILAPEVDSWVFSRTSAIASAKQVRFGTVWDVINVEDEGGAWGWSTCALSNLEDGGVLCVSLSRSERMREGEVLDLWQKVGEVGYWRCAWAVNFHV